jgi:hypothetical protein
MLSIAKHLLPSEIAGGGGMLPRYARNDDFPFCKASYRETKKNLKSCHFYVSFSEPIK